MIREILEKVEINEKEIGKSYKKDISNYVNSLKKFDELTNKLVYLVDDVDTMGEIYISSVNEYDVEDGKIGMMQASSYFDRRRSEQEYYTLDEFNSLRIWETWEEAYKEAEILITKSYTSLGIANTEAIEAELKIINDGKSKAMKLATQASR